LLSALIGVVEDGGSVFDWRLRVEGGLFAIAPLSLYIPTPKWVRVARHGTDAGSVTLGGRHASRANDFSLTRLDEVNQFGLVHGGFERGGLSGTAGGRGAVRR
jgi:hypothetical protein